MNGLNNSVKEMLMPQPMRIKSGMTNSASCTDLPIATARAKSILSLAAAPRDESCSDPFEIIGIRIKPIL